MAPPLVCQHGCARWAQLADDHNNASQASVNRLWMSPAMLSSAGAACAIPGNLGVPDSPICYCAGTAAQPTSARGRCADPLVPTPQQINLQYGASQDELIVSFVTIAASGAPLAAAARANSTPVVELCDAAACVNATGTSTLYREAQHASREYLFQFVPLTRDLLVPGTHYTYRCISGESGAVWSSPLTFRMRDAAAPLRFALFGDMGLYPFNNLGNLVNDVEGELVEAVVHLGDLAYNLAMDNGTRGDGYLMSMQRVVGHVPWITVIGELLTL